MPEQEQTRENRPPRGPSEGGRGPGPGGRGPDRGGRDDRRDDRRGDRGDRGRPEGPPEIELEKLMADSLYLDNQAHGIVSRMRAMDSGTKRERQYAQHAPPCRRGFRRGQFVPSAARGPMAMGTRGARGLLLQLDE